MQPPASSSRNSQNTRGWAPSASSSNSALSNPAAGHVNTAPSTALQGATLAFNNLTANTTANGSSGRGPSPSKPPRPPSQRNTNTYADRNAILKDGPDTRLQGNTGALLAATQAARDHAARPRSGEERWHTTTGLSRHATGSSGGQSVLQDARPGSESGGYTHAHGGVVAQRLSELHSVGGGGGSSSTLLSPPLGAGRLGGDGSRHGATSPSLIAATLAASRSASPVRDPSPQPTVTGKSVAPDRGRSVGAASISARSPGLGTGGGMRLAEVDAPDTASIPPTTSLVSLFEGKKGGDDVDPVKKRVPLPRRRSLGSDRLVAVGATQRERPKPKPKPKPGTSTDTSKMSVPAGVNRPFQRTGQEGHGRTYGQDEGARSETDIPPGSPKQRQTDPQAAARKPKLQADRPPTPPASEGAQQHSSELFPPRGNRIEVPRPEAPAPPAGRSSIAKMMESAVQIAAVGPENGNMDARTHQERASKPRRFSQSSTSSDDTFVSASSVQSLASSPVRGGQQAAAVQPNNASSSGSPVPRHLQKPPVSRASTPSLTVSSLTSAIVASNLAATRLTGKTSSQPPPPVPAPRRGGRDHASLSPLQPQRTAESIRSQLTGGGSKSPNRRSPQPPQHQQQRTGMLLQTLRDPHPSLSDDEDARRRMQHHNHHRRRNKVLHPGGNRKHAHHEGSRRRWRDEITPRERRRYEAVWASNRGLFLKPGWAFQYPHHHHHSHGGLSDADWDRVQAASRAVDGPAAELVVNVVVRDIWSRSRLPDDELAEVWDLVDRGRRGALAKDEFVVGMWLIDQRLRGRKIPARVGQSVWDSAGGRGVAAGVVVPPPKGGRKKG